MDRGADGAAHYARPAQARGEIRPAETFMDPDIAPGQRQAWYRPYVEGMTIDEAMNELAFLGTGLYGKGLENKTGAVAPCAAWKYGFKGIKSVVRITFTDQRPLSFWEQLAENEYGFWRM